MQLWNKTLKFYFANPKVTKKHLPHQLQNHLCLKQIPRDPLLKSTCYEINNFQNFQITHKEASMN